MDKVKKRKLDILVLSDVHLGTYGCHATELLHYLKSVKPKIVILNGDIIDIWQFSKRYWPKAHMKVIKQILHWMGKGVKIYYITGNHDEMLRKFVGFKMGSLRIVNKVILPLENGKTAWFFHGDVFDITMQHSKWLAKLGAIGYDTLILINRVVNFISEKVFKKGKLSLSKKIKNSVKSAGKFINSFEQTAADIAIENKYEDVYTIKYEEMFDNNFEKLRNIFDSIGLEYDADIFSKRTTEYKHNGAEYVLDYDKEGNYDDIYRTWQINQPFQNMNGNINLPDDFSQMIANSPIIQKLGYFDPRITH